MTRAKIARTSAVGANRVPTRSLAWGGRRCRALRSALLTVRSISLISGRPVHARALWGAYDGGMATVRCQLSWILASALACGSSAAEGPSPQVDAAANASQNDSASEATSPVDTTFPADATYSVDATTPTSDASPSEAAPSGDGGNGAPSDGAAATGRTFPDTYSTIAILADQFPPMNAAQQRFAATHYVGTQKQVLDTTHALRAINPNFLVLHYHLAMWQSAPMVTFITDGTSWANDYPTVTAHEDWFWHNAGGQRVPSSVDGKLLMNVSVAGFQNYWADSLAQQVKAGDYDAIFLDSASPALLQGECAGMDPRLAGTAVRSAMFAELGNTTWISAWQAWVSGLGTALAAKGIPLIPNTGAFITTWDNSNYALTPGIFSEGFASTRFVVSDWQASTNELLSLAAADKIMILQNYLSSNSDVGMRLYYLGNYLLVKGHHTYLDYFSTGPLEWYPEWGVDLGPPTTASTSQVSALLDSSGVYRRDFAKGSVFVNPSQAPVTVQLRGTFQQLVPSGGGAVDGSGAPAGILTTTAVTSIVVAPTSATIVLK
jgi:hypothetical protein